MLGSAPADEAAIGSVMSSYEAALNASNTEAVMPLYAEDGVFMAPNNKSAVGKGRCAEPMTRCSKPSCSRSSSRLWSLS